MHVKRMFDMYEEEGDEKNCSKQSQNMMESGKCDNKLL